MTRPAGPPSPPPPISLPAAHVVLLAELLTDLDGFLRSDPAIWDQLRAYTRTPGRPDPGYLIDAVSLSALWLRAITTPAQAGEIRPAETLDLGLHSNP